MMAVPALGAVVSCRTAGQACDLSTSESLVFGISNRLPRNWRCGTVLFAAVSGCKCLTVCGFDDEAGTSQRAYRALTE